MTYPVVTIKALTTIFGGYGIDINRHELGFYEARMGKKCIQATNLITLSEGILNTFFQVK